MSASVSHKQEVNYLTVKTCSVAANPWNETAIKRQAPRLGKLLRVSRHQQMTSREQAQKINPHQPMI